MGQIIPSDRSFSQTAFVAANAGDGEVSDFFRKGVRAFIIDGNHRTEGEIKSILSSIAKLLNEQRGSIVSVMITGNYSAPSIEKAIQQSGLSPYICLPDEKGTWPLLKTMIRKNKRLVVFSKNPCKLTFPIDKHIFFTDYKRLTTIKTALPKPAENSLICYNPIPDKLTINKKDTLLLGRTFYLWNRKGEIPNFLVSSPSNLAQTLLVADSINKTPFYSGRFICNDGPINNIHRMLRKEVMYNSTFTIPESSPYGNMFTPWKEGYRFYPEIVKLDERNSFQQITAVKLDLDDDLLYHFSFEQGVQNDVDQNAKNKLPVKINFKHDKIRGKVAVFDAEGAAIQCEKNSNFKTKEPFTISVWVKPYKVDGTYAILGKGQIFSAKIQNKKLSLTGTWFDPIITQSPDIKPNVWQQLTWVIISNYHIQFFVNGTMIEEQKIGDIHEDEYYGISIGNNFSNEGFCGEMDELKIWDRALSREEIAELYCASPEHGSSPLIYMAFAACLAAIFIIIFLRRRKTKIKPDIVIPASTETTDVPPVTPTIRHGIYLFGPLSVINESDEDLSLQLTPKMRQLFLLLILNERGISVNRINEELWPGTDEEKAKQNRNYTIQQLKKVIARMNGITLEYQSKNWILQIGDEVFVDVARHEKLVKQILSEPEKSASLVQAYVSLVERGKFMQGIDLESFDPVKARVSDQIIESLLLFAQNADSKLRLRLGNALLLHDSLNEDGLRLCLKSLTELGRNGEAHAIYNSFCKRYQTTYNEDFSSSFSEIIS